MCSSNGDLLSVDYAELDPTRTGQAGTLDEKSSTVIHGHGRGRWTLPPVPHDTARFLTLIALICASPCRGVAHLTLLDEPR
ncbi:hypothetical protein CORC01_05994 [Colletotrichum orchidophilum]|uniref:Uncharacterized protein n=1 Tax=Colletotrichum orchidophilum TaxID=1209926 RepID=A0A1G4BBG1_9PEZI|nr:uncharacterized protein CORC01_05994 [Colletotrichum orchidophilum]OHE98728.1 hypothetical protein CORC01_05994 [Colletotrichum orchidophilum]